MLEVTGELPKGYEARVMRLTVQKAHLSPAKQRWRIVWRSHNPENPYNVEARVKLADGSTGIVPRFKTRRSAIDWCRARGLDVAYRSGAGWWTKGATTRVAGYDSAYGLFIKPRDAS